MTMTTEYLGQRIAEARTRASLTQSQLAQGVGLDRSVLAKIESGARRVSALELNRIAQTVGVRIESLLREQVPAVVSHRNLADPGAASPMIDAEVSQRVEAVELLTRLDTSFTLPSMPVHAMPTAPEEAEALAGEARTALGVPAGGPLKGLGERVSCVGLMPFVVDLGSESADAATVLLASGAVTVINGHLAPGRRRLALAHEVGHALVADDYTVDWKVQEAASDRREALFDFFARALLMPGKQLRKDWTTGLRDHETRPLAVRLASEYRVDFSTLSRRLMELDLIDGGMVSTIRSYITTRLDIQTMGLVVPVELEIGDVPPTYARSVERLYLGEKISAARALDLFFGAIDEADLPALPSRTDDEIWQFVS
ncbi:hypothetical protein CWC38_07740 [Kocuria tytonicola]|uniref:helix-turn-helix domain-containing protein n=1 Tax=Kocuria tytonicola TaxID=2055946 RepID=UPI000EF95F9F|nr:XRE family transcriptional regulator [Kocuria tytonicola]RLZ03056.1 hypothetical protein CWC38_07740 [Kocuria tytonicola]